MEILLPDGWVFGNSCTVYMRRRRRIGESAHGDASNQLFSNIQVFILKLELTTVPYSDENAEIYYPIAIHTTYN